MVGVVVGAVVTVSRTVWPGPVTVRTIVRTPDCDGLSEPRETRNAASAPPASSAITTGIHHREGPPALRVAGAGACRQRVGTIHVSPASSCSAPRSSPTNSAALAYRARGSFASARSKTGSNDAGSSGFASCTAGTGALTCAIASAVAGCLSNGRRPARSSQATTPSA